MAGEGDPRASLVAFLKVPEGRATVAPQFTGGYSSSPQPVPPLPPRAEGDQGGLSATEEAEGDQGGSPKEGRAGGVRAVSATAVSAVHPAIRTPGASAGPTRA